MTTRLRTYGLRFGLLLAALLLPLAACELILRAVGYYYVPFALEFNGAINDWRFKHVFEDAYFMYDPDLIWRPRPNCSVFNSQGFRGPELSPQKRAGEFRIFAIGDSNTIGHVPGGDDGFHGANWPEYLKEPLAAATGKDITVVNAGVWGYSSFQGLELLKRVLAYHPDMVLISFGSNDAQKVAVADARFNDSVFRSALFTTRTGQLVKAAWDRLRNARYDPRPDQLVFRVSVEEYRRNLAEIIRLCRANGVECVLLTRPFIYLAKEPNKPLWWKNFAPAYLDATLAVGRENQVTVVDVHKAFAGKKQLFCDESHFTEAGHRLAADMIARQIAPLVRDAK